MGLASRLQAENYRLKAGLQPPRNAREHTHDEGEGPAVILPHCFAATDRAS
jgi:hypothetical protein